MTPQLMFVAGVSWFMVVFGSLWLAIIAFSKALDDDTKRLPRSRTRDGSVRLAGQKDKPRLVN
jgi:hypothetical protein